MWKAVSRERSWERQKQAWLELGLKIVLISITFLTMLFLCSCKATHSEGVRLTPVYCHEVVSNNDSIYDCLVEYKVKYWGYLCELGVPSGEKADEKAAAICKRWKELR